MLNLQYRLSLVAWVGHYCQSVHIKFVTKDQVIRIVLWYLCLLMCYIIVYYFLFDIELERKWTGDRLSFDSLVHAYFN